MRYLFIVQGEGRGHMTQAITLSSMLRRNGHEVCEVLLAKCENREIPSFFKARIGAPIQVYDTPCFLYSKNKKRVNITKSLFYNMTPKRVTKYLKSMEFIHQRIEELKPDVVINFYELLAGLTNLRYRDETPTITIGHQYLMKHPDYEHGKGDDQGILFLRIHALMCGLGATKTLALSFYPMRDVYKEHLAVVPPLLRDEVLQLSPTKGDYILGYMLNHGYAEEVSEWSKQHPDKELHFFWDKPDEPETSALTPSLTMHAINDQQFIEYMAGCGGYITTAGFESVCEAMYLEKPLMLIPAHCEQEVNAKDAVAVYGGAISESFDIDRLLEQMDSGKTHSGEFREWVLKAEDIFLKHLTTLI